MSESTPRTGDRAKISAIITTYNEEHNLGDCLASLEWCDEVLVVDSFSTDRTRQIAEARPGVRFVQHDYVHAAAQKNWAMQQVEHDWILILDADERCTEKLRQEIEDLLRRGPEQDSYRIRRRLFFLQRPIRFCGWHRDTVVRLVRRGRAHYPDLRVHADMVTEGSTPLLSGVLDHYMVHDPEEYIRRITRYGLWGAAQAWADGRSAGFAAIVLRPMWRFLRAYVVQLGFLDGLRGLAFCLIQGWGTFLKYFILWGWRTLEKLGRTPNVPSFDGPARASRRSTEEERQAAKPPRPAEGGQSGGGQSGVRGRGSGRSPLAAEAAVREPTGNLAPAELSASEVRAGELSKTGSG